jgi:hypothetical protein
MIVNIIILAHYDAVLNKWMSPFHYVQQNTQGDSAVRHLRQHENI